MFWFKNKLDKSLHHAMKNDFYKKYRVLIYCKNFKDNIEKKIKSYRGSVVHSIRQCSIICAYLSSKSILQLIEFPEVSYVAFDSVCFLCSNSVESSNKIRVSKEYKATGRGISIALLDTGVYPHRDLLTPFNRIKIFKDLVNDFRYPYDDEGHGTHTAGIIAGNGNLSKGVYRGIAPGAQLYCYKVFNSQGKAYVSDILFAIEEIISSCQEHNIRVLCLPFELHSCDTFLLDCFSKIFDIAIQNNIVPVVPSGSNKNIEESIQGFSALPNCITVGGINTTRGIESYSYSSCGPFQKNLKPDLVAACVDIISLNTDSSYISERNGIKLYPPSLEEPYAVKSGTSAACAFVAGVCALILENNQSLTFKDIKALLKASCNALEMPRFQQGNGMLDLSKIIK